jgi:hypothetical protein
LPSARLMLRPSVRRRKRSTRSSRCS